MNKECFVIQPISDSKFTKRYDDTYKPAIETAGLSAYRVDLDPAVKIPIEEIELKIKASVICFADISVDNPNVWYELGYAFASGKDVVMICDESRKDFPFDVRHKNIIRYKTESTSDFNTLKEKIIERIKAYVQSQKTTEKMLKNPIKETDEFQPYELTLLNFIVGEQSTEEEVASLNKLRNKMNEAGFNNTAFSIGMRLLKAKELITITTDSDFNGNLHPACYLSDKGECFVLKNTNLFDLQQTNTTRATSDDLPF